MFECDICNKSYKYKRNLVRHIMEKHSETLGHFNCPQPGCKGKSIRREYLRLHLINIHSLSKEQARELSYSVYRSNINKTFSAVNIEEFFETNSNSDSGEFRNANSFGGHKIAAPYSDLEDVSSDDLVVGTNQSGTMDNVESMTDIELDALQEITEEELNGASCVHSDDSEKKHVTVDFQTDLQSIIDNGNVPFEQKDIQNDSVDCEEDESVSKNVKVHDDSDGNTSIELSENKSAPTEENVCDESISVNSEENMYSENEENVSMLSEEDVFSENDENSENSAINETSMCSENSYLYSEESAVGESEYGEDIEVIDISDDNQNIGQEMEKRTLRTEVEVWSRTGFRYTTFRGDEPLFSTVRYEDDYYSYTMKN